MGAKRSRNERAVVVPTQNHKAVVAPSEGTKVVNSYDALTNALVTVARELQDIAQANSRMPAVDAIVSLNHSLAPSIQLRAGIEAVIPVANLGDFGAQIAELGNVIGSAQHEIAQLQDEIMQLEHLESERQEIESVRDDLFSRKKALERLKRDQARMPQLRAEIAAIQNQIDALSDVEFEVHRVRTVVTELERILEYAVDRPLEEHQIRLATLCSKSNQDLQEIDRLKAQIEISEASLLEKLTKADEYRQTLKDHAQRHNDVANVIEELAMGLHKQATIDIEIKQALSLPSLVPTDGEIEEELSEIGTSLEKIEQQMVCIIAARQRVFDETRSAQP